MVACPRRALNTIAITTLSALRPKQVLAVRHFLRGSDVFVSLPKGSCKSLCYYLLPTGPSISVPVHAVRHYVLSDASPARLARATFLRCFFSSSLSPQAVYGMDDISSNLEETHPETCPHYRKHQLPPASKVAKQTRWKN